MGNLYPVQDEIGSIFTPDQILQFQMETDSNIRLLEKDILRNQKCMGPVRLNGWAEFVRSWKDWLASHRSYWQRMWGSTAEQLDHWRAGVRKWQATLRKVCAEHGKEPALSTPALGPLPRMQLPVVAPGFAETGTAFNTALKILVFGGAGILLWNLYTGTRRRS